MYAGQYKVPLVVRMPYGAGHGLGASHSQSLEALIQIPGLLVAAPTLPTQRGCSRRAIRETTRSSYRDVAL